MAGTSENAKTGEGTLTTNAPMAKRVWGGKEQASGVTW